jgi:hypothetical protein
MMDVIAWDNPETGNVAITIPAYDDPFRPPDLNDKEFLDAVRLRTLPRGAEYIVIDVNEQPASRVFRQAWRIVDNKVIVDMERARAIRMDEIREDRAIAFETLDIEYIRATEKDDSKSKAQIVALKQLLRDIPQTFDLTVAKTPEELEKLSPVIPAWNA